MSTTKAILSALWRSRNARRLQPAAYPIAAAVSRELYRRELRDSVLAEVYRRAGNLERYRQPEESGVRWVTIGGSDGEGGTPVQIDGSGTILKGPPALKGKPADNPDAGKQENRTVADSHTSAETEPAQGEVPELESVNFDETAANSSLSKSGKAEHGGVTVEIVDNPEGKQWGYAARVTKADGSIEHVSNHGQGKGTSWREAQGNAVKALRSAGEHNAPQPGGNSTETPENKARSAGEQDGDSFQLEHPKNAPHQPGEHQAELFGTKGKSDVPRGVTELPDGRRLGAAQLKVGDLKADPKRFQYKISGIDAETGVTKELKEVKAFNPLFAGQLLVWHDPKENQTYVVNGHHRFDLARRADYGGTLNVFYIDEPSAEGARAMGALANIAEGRGTAVDAAKFMRDSGKSVSDLQGAGISLQGKIAADGAVLSKMSEHIFQDLTNGITTESRAMAIGRHVSKPEVQEQLYRRLKKQEQGPRPKETPDAQVEEIAREYELAGTTTDRQTGGLFGDLESEESLVFQRAELKSFLRKEFSAERNTFKGISTKGRVARISEESGNVLNVEANKERAQAADAALWSFNQLANLKGPVADAIQEAAEAYYHEPRKRKTIFSELRRSILERIDVETGGLRSDDAQRSRNAADGDSGTGDGSARPAESIKEQFSREFARREILAYNLAERIDVETGTRIDKDDHLGGRGLDSFRDKMTPAKFAGNTPRGDLATARGLFDLVLKYSREFDEGQVNRAPDGEFASTDSSGIDKSDAPSAGVPPELMEHVRSELAKGASTTGIRKNLPSSLKPHAALIKKAVDAATGGKYVPPDNEPKRSGPNFAQRQAAKRLAQSKAAEAKRPSRELASDDPQIDKNIADAHESLIAAGATQDAESDSGSRYYTMPGGQQVRVSDHEPNEATQQWIDRESVVQILAHHRGFRSSLDSLLNPEPEDTRERFSRAFAERYAAPVAVVETSRKRSQLAANYRPAFGAARCGTCEFYRAGACSHVAGQIRPEDVCDLFIYARDEHWQTG